MKIDKIIKLCRYTDKSSFKLTEQLLETLYLEASNAKKDGIIELTMKTPKVTWVITMNIKKEK